MDTNFTQFQNLLSAEYLHKVELHIGNVLSFIISFEILTTLLLSFFWGVHLIRKLWANSKAHKLEVSMLPPEDSRSAERKYRIARNKNLLLLAICISEYILVISVVILSLMGNSLNDYDLMRLSFHDLAFPSFNHSISDNFITFRIVNSFFLTSFLSLLLLIRITTQYLHSQYNYFKEYFRLKPKLLYFCCVSTIIFGLGIFRYSIIIQSILYPILLITEYIMYIRTSIKLKSCLYKRYFDSQHHDYLEKWVTQYYRRAHKSFKLTFLALTIALFCRIIGFIYISTMPQIYVLKSLIPNLPSIAAIIPVFSFEKVLYIIVFSVFLIGSVFLVIPYVLFSLGYLYLQIKRWNHFRKNTFYSNPTLIRNLIKDQNSAYDRTVWRF